MIEHRARLPLGYSVLFKWTDNALRVEWTPFIPAIRSPRQQRKFRAAYNQARRDFFASVATAMGGRVLIADIDGPIETIAPAVKH